MATTRNFALLLAILMAALAFAIGLTVARAIASHGTTSAVIAASASPAIHHDM